MEKAKILIVEDEAIIAAEIESNLQSLGYEITSVVNTGKKAIEKVEIDKPDIILMDIRIKGEMDGIDAAEIIRSRFGVPVIFSTAYTDEERIQRAKITMPFGYLLKPIQDRDLKVTVEMALYVAKVEAERKQAEKNIKKSEAKYRDLVELMPQGMFEADEFGNLIFANRTALEMFGYSETDLNKGLNILQIISPEDRERAGTNISLVMDGQQFGGIEYTAITKKDQKFPIIIYSSSISPENRTIHKGIVIDITEQKKVKEKLQESEEKYRAAFKTSPDSVNINRMDGLYVDINDGYTQLTGYSYEDVIGKLSSEINIWAIPEDRERLITGLNKNGYVENLESTFKCKDDSFKTALLSARMIELNNEPHILSISRDITDRIQAEKELRLTKHSIDNSSNATFWIRQNGQFRYANKAACLLTGYSHQELLNIYYWDLDHSFSPGTFSENWQELEDRGTYTFESVCTDKNSRRIPVEVTTNLHDFEGEKYIFAYVLDITERRKSELDRTRLVSAIEQSSDNIVITDIKGNIEYVNPAFERNTGYSRTEVFGQNPRILKSGKHNDNFYLNLWETITNGGIWTGNIINKRKDEKLIEESATIFPVLASSGEIRNFVAVKRDMTEQNKMENQIRQMEKLDAIGILSSGIAHDFNNILGAIFGYTQLLKRKLPDSPEHKKLNGYLDKIFSASGRAKELIDQILMFSRKGDYNPKFMDLQPLLKESMKFLRSTLPTTISIKLSIDPNLNNIYGDATQIQQVVMNLCTNASHAMEEKGGTLEIALTNFEIKQKTVVTGNLDPGDYLCLTVSDTGKGMNDETKQRIFEPFFTTKEKGKGTGLGLSSAHGIISKHGGIINVDSKEDLGTRFDIYLPAWINDAEGTEKEVEPELPTGSESILFVDDESDLCDVYGEMLKSQGYRVQTTSSSRDALDRFIKNSCAYDLIVTDYTMPEMNGIELSREIHKYNNNMPVILISGLGELIPDEELKSTGIVARYSKPIEFGTLIRGVKEILDKKFG